MKHTLTRRFAAAALGLATVLAAAQPAEAQRQQRLAPPQQPVVIPAGGTELFRAMLDQKGVQPVRAQDVWNVADSRTIVVIIGTRNLGGPNSPLHTARQVLRRGGAVLIAGDTYLPLFDSFLQNEVGAINGTSLYATDPLAAHWPSGGPDNWKLCPFVVPISPEEFPKMREKPGPIWNVFRGLNKIATNSPSFLQLNPNVVGTEYQYPLARLPLSVTFNQFGQGKAPPNLLFAVGGEGPPNPWDGSPGYSFLVMADSSVFVNLMMMEPGTHNLTLSRNTIDYLQGPDSFRNRCIFYENGRVVEKFDDLRNALATPKQKMPPGAPNLPGLAGKNQDKLADLANGLIDQFQKKDGLHNMLVGQPGSARERRAFGKWIEIVAVLAAIFTVLFLLRRMVRSRQPLDVPPAPSTGAGVASTGPPGVFDRRQKELVRKNNIYEPIRDMLRKYFSSVGAPPNPGPKMPRLEVSDEVRKPDSLRQALKDLWRLAFGPPMTMTAQRWFELEPYFDRLKQAHADGKWRFLSDT